MSATASVLDHRISRVPSIPQCLLLLFAIKLSLRVRGLGRTLALIRRRAPTPVTSVVPGPGELALTERAVAMAGALFPGRALCLEQSLVLYYLLRRRRVPVTYCQGIQPHPFASHAWVEYQGEPINDVAEHVKRFARLPMDQR